MILYDHKIKNLIGSNSGTLQRKLNKISNLNDKSIKSIISQTKIRISSNRYKIPSDHHRTPLARFRTPSVWYQTHQVDAEPISSALNSTRSTSNSLDRHRIHPLGSELHQFDIELLYVSVGLVLPPSLVFSPRRQYSHYIAGILTHHVVSPYDLQYSFHVSPLYSWYSCHYPT